MDVFYAVDTSYPSNNNDHPTDVGGDSGSPNMIPTVDGQLVFFQGSTSSGPSPAMQAVMDALTTSQGLSPSNYQMMWYPTP